MKLRNLIFALFLAIGAIGFVSCTGDDGETGPAGPAGPEGEPGEPGADAGDVESNYAFLTNWGAASGMASCSSEVLTGTGVFPGPAELDMIVDANGNPSPARVNIVCAADGTSGALVAVDPDLNGDGQADGTTTNGLVFNRTHIGAEDPVTTPVPGEGDASPRVITTTKNFSGGTVHGQLAATGASDEAFSRSLLYHECGVGTSPPSVQGEFRAVRIVETDTVLEVEDDNTVATFGTYVPVAATAIMTTTYKVCVTLDSLPGVVKCYARVQVEGARAGTAIGTTETVGIYSDAMLHAVAPMAGMDGAITAVAGAQTGATNILGLDVNADDSFDDDIPVGGQICNLFAETANQS